MKRRTMILIIIGLIVVVYMLPLLWEILNFRIGFFTLCIGTGCSGSGGSQPGSPVPGTTWCDGYELGFLCLSNKKEYCFYSSPLSIDKCLCEAISNYEGRNVYRKFCPKNNLCYSNSFEYEFGCSEDMERTCRERERELETKPSCYNCMDPFIKRCSDCDKSWIERYSEASESERIDIFNRGDFTKDPSPLSERRIFLKPLCTLICQNCNTTLCRKDNLCEYYNLDQTTTKND